MTTSTPPGSNAPVDPSSDPAPEPFDDPTDAAAIDLDALAIDEGDEDGPVHLRVRKHRVARKLVGGLAIVVGLLVLAAGVGFALDGSNGNDRVARKVTLEGKPIGGVSRAQLAPIVHQVALDYQKAPVAIEVTGSDGTTIRSDTDTLGVRVDEDATIRAAFAVHKGGIPSRFADWARSYLDGDAAAPVVLAVDQARLAKAAITLDPGHEPPVEPSIVLDGDRFVSKPGRAGRGLAADDLASALTTATRDSSGALAVRIGRTAIAPHFDQSDADALAATALDATAKPMAVAAGGATGTLGPAELRPLVRSMVSADGQRLGLALDHDLTAAALAKALAKAGTPARNPTFAVQGSTGSKLVPGTLPGQVMPGIGTGVSVGQVVIGPGANGTACCDDQAPEVLQAAFVARPPGQAGATVSLGLKTVAPAITDAQAAALGVKEPIGSFTTHHAPGQPRVINIHKIADTVRGTLILPGQTFSVNALVGPRTTAKGYVEAPAIAEGVHVDEVGGGVSQFATTIYNAAFFGGMDLISHQSHSLYISRYPYGRDATLGNPAPDVVIRNPSDTYAVLVWTSYTAETVTVTLYSTQFAVGAQTGITETPSGPCTRVSVTRTRTFVSDGHTVTDKIPSLYRPAEGVKCP